MSFDADAEYARRLQAEFDLEDAGTVSKVVCHQQTSRAANREPVLTFQ